MGIRLNKVLSELNIGLQTAVEFLKNKTSLGDIRDDANLTTKINDDQYKALVSEFKGDKDVKSEAEKIFSKKVKEKNEKKVTKAEELLEQRQQFKPVGKIDLESVGKKPSDSSSVARESQPEPKAAAVSPKPEQKPEVKPAPVENKPEVSAQKIQPKPVETAQPIPAAVQPKAEAPVEKKPVEAAEHKMAEPVQNKPVAPAQSATPVQPTAPAQPEQHKPSATQPVAKQAVNAQPKPAAPVAQNQPKHEAPKQDAPKNDAPQQEAPQQEATAESEGGPKIFTLKSESKLAPKVNVLGKIDLSTLNQSTRPKKKTKEERKKEREEKAAQAHPGERRKRERIGGKERVNIEAAANQQGNNGGKKNNNGGNNNNNNNRNGNNGNNRNNNGNNQNGNYGGGNGKKRNNKNRQPQKPLEVNEEDVARQVKETLARLTSKSQNKKGAKYRREKRDAVQERINEEIQEQKAESKTIKLTEFVTVSELATMMDVPANKVIGTCMSIGIMVSINQRLDAETINLVAEEFGFKTEYVSAEVAQAVTEEEDAEEDLLPRAPIVTVMGHVDHGKTSLLDYIRKANVIAGEAGGITQHIGAYNVKLEDGRRITFLDTPGHEAFTAMRARGAKVTDIAIIIVAADDNVMPQTKEAINHAMAAGVPIVFAINKIDKPHANPDKIKQELASMNYLVEEWGGKYQSQDISAKQGLGVHELLEKVLLEAEMLDLKANPNRKAAGSIIESTLDKGRGYVATVLVANGTLNMGDIVLAGTSYGKVKAMFNERNQRIKVAGPSEPVLILGLNGAPAAGDTFHVIETEQEARDIANKREQLQREQGLRTQKMLTLDEVGRRLAIGDFHELNIIVKGDVDGSVEALSDSLIKLSTEQVQVNVIHKGVGQISESDVTLAAASNAIMIGFQVRPSSAAARLAEQDGVDIRKYSVIYDAIEEVKSAMEGMLAPKVKEEVTSNIEVREVFNITKVGIVAGAIVKSGKVKRSDKARIIREGIVVFSGNINALKRFKDDVKEVGVNFECGISLTNCNDIKVGDIIETYEEIEVKQTL